MQLQNFGKPLYSGFPKPCNRKAESGSDWSELVGQIAHIDHVTRFLQLVARFWKTAVDNELGLVHHAASRICGP